MAKTILQVLAVIALLSLIGSCVYFGPELREHFGTRYADADREVFENSKPYIHGALANLTRLKLQYELSDNVQHKAAIKAMVMTEVSTLDAKHINPTLTNWIQSL